MKFENLLGQRGTAVAKRLGWKQGDEEESWSKKAIDSLMKKLQKHNKEALASLEMALQCQGRQRTDCVTIPRSLDGRLQISHRKALPHVIYCRVYRWPDLQSHHELKAIDDCRYCYESGQKDVCINPYHYERVESAGILPPVLVPRYTEPPPHIIPRLSRLHTGPSASSMPCNIDFSHYSDAMMMSKRDDEMSSNVIIPNGVTTIEVPYEERKFWATISYFELNTRVGEQYKVSSPTVEIDGFTDPTSNSNKICLGLLSNVNRNQQIESTRRRIGRGLVSQLVNFLRIYKSSRNAFCCHFKKRVVCFLHVFFLTSILPDFVV
ncbi:unnamed protein product, partial [Onchocerca flexuosa]|uniref:Mothers against decapentaplegic homolog n=1 Tax=Onchocerca flexuosa TaxID=387005 RepID=A0A183GZ64_9BILA